MSRGILPYLLLCTIFGCHLAPEIAHQSVIHNPFPQIHKVAVAPFFNLSTEPSVDGRQFAIAYFTELQMIPGFEVVPVGVVEQVVRNNQLTLESPEHARRLAQILGVDAVIIGAITDYQSYEPQRCGLQIEWYAANPCFHPVPPGYALPWGTTDEEYIPERLRLETELALARAQLKTESPTYKDLPEQPMSPKVPATPAEEASGEPEGLVVPNGQIVLSSATVESASEDREPVSVAANMAARIDNPVGDQQPIAGESELELPVEWPDESGLIPAQPSGNRPPCVPSDEPILKHTKMFSSTDPELIEALKSYAFFLEDSRPGDYRAYLERSFDFQRFCSRMHIHEMLSARGGADETRVVYRRVSDR